MRRLICLILFLPVMALASGNAMELFPFTAHTNNKASLQRGARIYMNYCAGCHSLHYMRYSRMAKDIGVTNDYGDILLETLKNNLIFTGSAIHSHIKSSMSEAEGKRWFGVAPPDLTLEMRVRGASWVYTYLRTFYEAPLRPWGANNMVYRDVAMPNVLLAMQGEQIPVYRSIIINSGGKDKTVKVIDHLKIVKNGSMTPEKFDSTVGDLINFLSYVSEPMKSQQRSIGFWVLIFMVVFAVVAYLLKKEYWRDIH